MTERRNIPVTFSCAETSVGSTARSNPVFMISVLDVLVVKCMQYPINEEQDVFNGKRRYNEQNEDCKDVRANCGEKCKDDIAEKGSAGGGLKMAGSRRRWIFELLRWLGKRGEGRMRDKTSATCT